MINFWFRSKTSTPSRYLACLPSSGHVAARRPGTWSVPRRLQFKHLTTLFYSSIIATAAAADVKAKRARREQWNTAIRNEERLLQEVKDRSGNDNDGWEPAANDACTYTKSEDSDVENMLLEELDKEIKLGTDRDSDVYDDRIKFPKIEERARVAPQSMYANNFRRSTRSESWTMKKLVTAELAVAKLTTGFLLEVVEVDLDETGRHGTPNDGSATALSQQELMRRLERVCTGLQKVKERDSATDDMDGIERIELPKYQLNISGLEENQHELNIAMVHIFRKFAAGKLTATDMLSKISYNLLVAKAPPSLMTWTLLISRFSRLQQHRFVDMVLKAIEEIHVRPNEMTVSAILAHYTRKKSFYEFRRYVRKLEGYHGGLMLARKDIAIGVGAPRLRKWNDKIIQCITFDAHIYYSVIWGYLAFHDLPNAVLWYRRMLQDGFQADLQLLVQFLRFFSATEDWSRGLGIWRAIQNLVVNPKNNRFEMTVPEEIQSAYYFMLQLCQNCQQSKYFKTVYEEGSLRGLTMDKLFSHGLFRRGFSSDNDGNELLRRRVRIVKHRIFLMSRDQRKWGLQSLASKLILRGLDLGAVQVAFRRHGDDNSFREWLADRPWFQLREDEEIFAKSPLIAEIEKNEDGSYNPQKTYRFSNKKSDGATSDMKLQLRFDSSENGAVSRLPEGLGVQEEVDRMSILLDRPSVDDSQCNSRKQFSGDGFLKQEHDKFVACFA